MSQIIKGDITPLSNDLLAYEMESGEKLTRGGLILLDDNGKNHGIRPRWCKVYKVGKKAEQELDIHAGQYILVEHGRWTRQVDVEVAPDQILKIQKIEIESILLVQDDMPE